MTAVANKILGSDGRALMVAVDHTAHMDTPVRGLENYRAMVELLTESGAVDSFIAPIGAIRRLKDSFGEIPIVAGLDTTNYAIQALANYASELGATGVKSYLYPFSGDSSVIDAQLMSIETSKLEMAFIAEPFPGGMDALEMRTPDHIIAAARVAFETGADVIKTLYTGDRASMERLVQYCDSVPVVVLGGSRNNDVEAFLTAVRDSIDAGCVGAAIGANIFGNPNPAGMAKALNTLIHEDVPVSKVLGLI